MEEYSIQVQIVNSDYSITMQGKNEMEEVFNLQVALIEREIQSIIREDLPGEILLGQANGILEEIKGIKDMFNLNAVHEKLEALKEELETLKHARDLEDDPQHIDDLKALVVDSHAVFLNWTARSGDGEKEKVRADRYILYYSSGELNKDNYKSANQIVLPFRPASPGVIQSFVLSGLDPDNLYYIVIVPETVSDITRQAGVSNILSIRTDTIVVPAGQSEYIKVKPHNVITYVKRFHKDAVSGETLGAGNSVDGAIISENGTPRPDSVLGKVTSFSYTGWKPSWPQEAPIRMVVDLEELHRVDYLYLYTGKNSTVEVMTSYTGSDWVSAGELVLAFNKWVRINIPEQAKECRYVKFLFPVPLDVHEVAVFGAKISNTPPVGVKHRNLVPQRTFEGFMGTNSFLNENPNDYGKFGKIVRYYCNTDWFTPLSVNNYNTKFSLEKTNGVPYEFATSRLWNFDEQLREAVDLGIEVFWCGQGSVNWLLAQSQQNKLEFKPIDTPQIPSSTDSESPFSYRFFAQFMFQVAARYGSNSNIPDSLLRLGANEPIRKGLGLIKYMEAWNEPDKTWEQATGYFSPYELASMLSAVYDGHKGQLGAGFGIKQADPNMIIVLPGLTEINIDYCRYMFQWWDTNRGMGDYPFDIFNFHIYSNTSGGNQVETSRKGEIPEIESYVEALRGIVEYRNIYFPNKEIWISETGYDEHPASNQAPPANIGNRLIGGIKADWLLRTFLLNYAIGIDAVQQYMYRGAGNTLAQITGTGYPSVYLTSGYVDYRGTPENRYEERDSNGNLVPVDPRLASYFYTVAMIKDLTGMRFSHVIKAETLETEGVLLNPSDTVYAMAFKPAPGASKGNCIIVWHGSRIEKETVETILVDNVQRITVQRYRGLEEIKEEQSIIELLPTVTDPDNGRIINLEVNETPVLVWTNRIGVKQINPAKGLKLISQSTNSVRLFWEDVNTEDYLTEIYRSTKPDSGFAIIKKDYFTECFFVDEGLTGGTYYYMLRLTSPDGSRKSSYTEILACTTMRALPGVTSIEQSGANVNRLTISWQFPEVEEPNISGFEIFKSSTPTGIYHKLATTGAGVRSFQDIGLVENTTYYYKLRTFSPIGYSEFSGYMGATTTEAQIQPPAVMASNTTYFGDKVFIFFNIPVKDAEGAMANFTVFEAGANVPIKTISSIGIDTNGQRVVINLATPIEQKSNVVKIGYDGLGAVSSVFGVNLRAFSEYQLNNLVNDSSLVSNKAIVSLNTFSTPQFSPEGENFNELLFLTNGSQEQVVNASMINTDGEPLPWTAIAPYVANTYVMESSSTQTPTVNSSDPNHPFGLKEKRSGRMDSAYTASWNTVAFLGLDVSKRYNIKAFVTHNAATPDPRSALGRVQLNDDSLQVVNARQNVENLLVWENIAPENITLQAKDEGVVIPNIGTPKIIIQTKSDVRGQSIISCAYYIEEVMEIIPDIF